MTRFQAVYLATLLLGIGACGNSTPPAHAAAGPAQKAATPLASASVDDVPELPEAYRSKLERAFKTASESRDPTMACNGIIARAAGNPPANGNPAPEAVRAYELCYIDVRARYIESLLATITPEMPASDREAICSKVGAHLVVSRAGLGSFAKNVGLDPAALDRKLSDRVAPTMRATCAEQIPALGLDD